MEDTIRFNLAVCRNLGLSLKQPFAVANLLARRELMSVNSGLGWTRHFGRHFDFICWAFDPITLASVRLMTFIHY